jgi:hypothetical protein
MRIRDGKNSDPGSGIKHPGSATLSQLKKNLLRNLKGRIRIRIKVRQIRNIVYRDLYNFINYSLGAKCDGGVKEGQEPRPSLRRFASQSLFLQ